MRIVFNAQLATPFFLSRCVKSFFDAGRAYQYSVNYRNHCAGGMPYSEATVIVRARDSETCMGKILS